MSIGRYSRSWIVLFVSLSFIAQCAANDAPVSNPRRIEPDGIKGSLLICGGGKLPEELTKLFVQTAGGKQAKIVVIPTARGEITDGNIKSLSEEWKKRGAKSVVVLHATDRKQADSNEFIKPLTEATGVWFGGGSQSRIADAYLGTAVEQALGNVLKRGGIIGGTSAGAAIMSRVMIASGNPEAVVKTGFDLLPGTVIDQHFLARKRKPRLLGVLKKRGGLVGVGIDEGTGLLVTGRRMRVVGESTVTILLPASKTRPVREILVKSREFADLIALRRAALARALPTFPVKMPSVPNVEKGSLVIVGGGGMPEAVTKKFIELAGGPEALIVVLPTAVPDVIARRQRVPRYLTAAGAKNVKVLPVNTPAELAAAEFIEVLKKASGVWFGGGRQWRFVDAYDGSGAVKLFHDVLRRGGVIGGSSAGASIQAEYMVRGHPLGNRVMMAEGYERGFNFLPGVAIDQHFSQRKRFADMTSVMETFPQLLGIGIDEATALVVQGHTANIIGRNGAHFYDYSHGKPDNDGHDYKSVATGGQYDLKNRRAILKSE
ncbi:MAG: cyanophycinase [Planctomycetaceae bacterium]|jgi:cyanophycinase|nr:cyanophycinase [Planctomycetaceae bacterium]MBT6156183.1 cyanophycinase [Planctomycetaceae bacterium]MBT6487158.1 cyanophycinase [Planctomycetaceae bacterium]MBT6494450.1 cyanophycinase [Planctomycetaceae bacterium]